MGRIGAGEATTILFLLAIVLYAVVPIALIVWARRLIAAGRSASAGLSTAAAAIVVPLLGVVGAIVYVSQAFARAGEVDAAHRAQSVATAISEAMNVGVLGLIVSAALVVVSLGLLVHAWRRPASR